MKDDAEFMALALAAAQHGDPSPNPHVGAVVVRDGEVLGVGHHARAGLAHAEVAALGAAGESRGATLYVTLEPCNHHGRTGPCTEAVLAAGIARVVIGSCDPAPHVEGATERLRAAGIEVVTGVLESECDWLLAPFRKHIQTGLSHVTLKAALTLDGRMATRTGDSQWVTGEAARRRVHEMRATADAILVGVGTLLKDDPKLTVRHVEGRDPMRVVVDSSLRSPSNAAALDRAGGGARVCVAHVMGANPARVSELNERGVETLGLPADHAGRVSLSALLPALGAMDVVKLLVEGGAGIHGTLLREGLADRAALFMAPKILGDDEAIPLARAGSKERMLDAWCVDRPSYEVLGDDILVQGEIRSGGEG